jgi:hypothetical protein
MGKLLRLHNLVKDSQSQKVCVLVVGTKNPQSDPNNPKRTGLDNPRFWYTVNYSINGDPQGSDVIQIKFVSTMNMYGLRGQGAFTGTIDEAGLYAYNEGDFSGIDIPNTPVSQFLDLSPTPVLFAYSLINPPISWDSSQNIDITFEWVIVSD